MTSERLAFSKTEAAAVLGVEIRFLNEHILPSLKVVRIGRKVLIPHRELERWLTENATFTLEQYRREATLATPRALEGSNRVLA